jgi:hypothetical protein
MELLTSLFNTIIVVPSLIAGLLYRFGQYLLHPYAAVLITCRALRHTRLSSAVMLISAYLLFALSLGIPGTRKLILTFDGGMTESLKRIPSSDLKGQEYLYLYLFVVGATAFSLIVGYAIRDILRLKRGQRGIFIDLFSVYIAFTLGWFLLIAMALAKLFSRHSLLQQISETLKD